jgi:hypothetical protein
MDKQEALQKIEELKQFVASIDSKSSLNHMIDKHYFEHKIDSMKGRLCIRAEGHYIVIDLPNNNQDWTFSAWDWAKTFCLEYENRAFVRFQSPNPCDKLYIDCKELIVK